MKVISDVSPKAFWSMHSDAVTSVAMSPDGGKVLTGSIDCTAKLWDAKTGALLKKFRLAIYGDEPPYYERILPTWVTATFSPDGNRILTGTNCAPELWSAESAERLRRFDVPFDREGGQGSGPVAFSPDGARVLCTGEEVLAQIWDAHNGELIKIIDGRCDLYFIAFSSDGARIALGSKVGLTQLLDTNTGEPIATFEGGGGVVRSAALSPDGTYVLVGGDGGTAMLWDSRTSELIKTFDGDCSVVYSVAFSLDGSKVLAGTSVNDAKLWDVHTGALIRSFKGHAGSVYAVAFSASGAKVLTGSADRTARLWDSVTGELDPNFSPNF